MQSTTNSNSIHGDFMVFKKNERFSNYSIVLNVPNSSEIDWDTMTGQQMALAMATCHFPNQSTLATKLTKFVGVAQNSNKSKSAVRRFTISEFAGQLEKGTINGRPHYNLAVKTSSKVLPSVLLRELSMHLYDRSNCPSINVQPSVEHDALKAYCWKADTRLELPSTEYYPPAVTQTSSDFNSRLEIDPVFKMIQESPLWYQRILFALIRSEPCRRVVNFVFNPAGGKGKSSTADFIELSTEFNAMLAPQLATPERWTTALIDQLEGYYNVNGVYPQTIMLDLTRNEDNQNVEQLYSTLENIKNGRLDSTFYGKFKRIRFKPPHVIVFTNTVPNMSALSQDRFRMFAIADTDFHDTLFLCDVKLNIIRYTKSMVTWNYVAVPKLHGFQKDFYDSIFESEISELAYSLVRPGSDSIYMQTFEGDQRTKRHDLAPEPVVERLVELQCIYNQDN